MTGSKSGVATRIKELNFKCLFTHCYGHALNLAVGNFMRREKLLSETLDVIKEITKLVKNSPQRDTHLKSIRKKENAEKKGIHAF